MADKGKGKAPQAQADGPATSRRVLRSHRERATESDASDSELAAHATDWIPDPQPSPSRSRRSTRQTPQPILAPLIVEQAPPATTPIRATEAPPRWHGNRRSLFMRNRQRGGRDSAVTSPSQANTAWISGSVENANPFPQPSYEHDLATALEHEVLGDDDRMHDDFDVAAATSTFRGGATVRHAASRASNWFADDWEESDALYHLMAGSTKRSRDRFEASDSNVQRTLNNRGAVAVVLYRNATPDAQANDIWPAFRSAAKLPARYYLLDKDSQSLSASRSRQRPLKIVRRSVDKGKGAAPSGEELRDAPTGRPKWDLPVELVELIAGYLNRDDIKSLRMVSHELNYYVSQVIFKTVVVPFNTEIYGMLAQGQKPDFKGKKRAKRQKPGYSWKNANGDEVYNGHGLDVFKGFGRHISRYGMSFEVNEDSLSQPPSKSLTEKKTSFWGAYDWPFEEYRRFDAVAGLETAADETPRMKIAFSELTRIKELALSVDSGLGWLSGPDRSIRARILQRPPAVFGTLKEVPDRRAQAQQELWSHMERQHLNAGQDIKLATLYRLDGMRPLSDLEEASMVAEEQPAMPYLDPHVIHDATPHETSDISWPASFDDLGVLDRFVLSPSSAGAGILFSSIIPPSDAGQIMSPIIPANLTKAQKEWLLETEWAQRAFMSSYMLSIIDNSATFTPVHTLNISRLSDRYISMLNRADFWDALPNLTNLTIMVIPGWRTVTKDEAGFVDTPRVNPISGLNSFCDLLTNHVANRAGIRSLAIGWIGGGEHAEGLHARNKLIMPAPLMPLGVNVDNNTVFSSEMMTELDPDRLRSTLLQFPHVERLTLKNCWITPAALLQFVKIHDDKSLQSLILNSVSLTAVLRPGNANQAAPQVFNAPMPPLAGLLGANALFNAFNNFGQGANPAQGQPLPNNVQVLQWLVQSLQAQLQHMQANAAGVQQQNQMTTLQAQLQQQFQQLQAQNQRRPTPISLHQGVIPAPARPTAATTIAVTALATQVQAMHQQVGVPAQQPVQPTANPQTLLQAQPRDGSWTNIIDIISPGPNLSDLNSTHSAADPDRQTSLRTLEFISCGYARLPHTIFDQGAIDHGNGLAAAMRNSVFSKRYAALAPAMQNSKWAHLGEIVQEVDTAELAALDAGWGLRTGWDDAEDARAVEFDGALPGGTGRFSGVVRREDRMRDADGDAS
ncbi:hypothetical protein CC86DRAFT_320134 [Ophiobolus disseminans]|uniref:F-box domain-containing protein n=1 Tax=Ophiobolus disseminans TaxID=1469910 RepID=A0A6A7A382_9PLEO|nr:hypothetical protein CC86DRAFT_320134 [Ophiobolus disseminans]